VARVVAEIELADVALEMLGTDVMIDAVDAALEEREIAVQRG